MTSLDTKLRRGHVYQGVASLNSKPFDLGIEFMSCWSFGAGIWSHYRFEFVIIFDVFIVLWCAKCFLQVKHLGNAAPGLFEARLLYGLCLPTGSIPASFTNVNDKIMLFQPFVTHVPTFIRPLAANKLKNFKSSLN